MRSSNATYTQEPCAYEDGAGLPAASALQYEIMREGVARLLHPPINSHGLNTRSRQRQALPVRVRQVPRKEAEKPP